MMGMLNNSDDPEHVPYEPLPRCVRLAYILKVLGLHGVPHH